MSEPMTDARLAEIKAMVEIDPVAYGLEGECAAEIGRLRAGIRTIMARDDVGMYAAAELALLLGEGQGS